MLEAVRIFRTSIARRASSLILAERSSLSAYGLPVEPVYLCDGPSALEAKASSNWIYVAVHSAVKVALIADDGLWR